MSLKDWMKKVETAQLNEFATNGQIQIKPASQMPKPAGQQQQAINGQQPQQGQTNANTQVITQNGKTIATVNDPQQAQNFKRDVESGKISLAGGELQEDGMKQSHKPTGLSPAFEAILSNHPHEHKMCQEGWGMHEGLYEALRDHYFREGRIPRELMHGDRESLRGHVESCYAEDTMRNNQDAINNGMLDEADDDSQFLDPTKQKQGYELPGSGFDLSNKSIRSLVLNRIRGNNRRVDSQEYPTKYLSGRRSDDPDLTMDPKELDRLLKRRNFLKSAAALATTGAVGAGLGYMSGKRNSVTYPNDGSEPSSNIKPTDNFKPYSKPLDGEITPPPGSEPKSRVQPREQELRRIKPGDKLPTDPIRPVKNTEKKPVKEMSRLERMLTQETIEENTMYESKNTKSVREATEKTKTGLKHKADAGGYGRKDDEEDTDEDGKKIKKTKKDEPKKGRGRPKKTDSASGEDKKFDFSALSKTSGSKAPKTDKWDKKKTTKVTKMKDGDKNDKDAQMESWDQQLKTMLNEDMSVGMPMMGSAAAPKTNGQQSTVPQQDDQSNVLADLLAMLRNSGIEGGLPNATPTPDAAGGDKLDGSELQSGVDGPVNDTESEPGSKDPRNNPISGQVFVPQLAMPRGMGMSVEGDVHTHEIDVKPQGPDEVQITLAKDSDNEIIDGFKDLISRISGGNTRDGEAKLIVPYGDYAQEEGEKTARDQAANAQVDATVGVQGDDVKQVAGTSGGIMSANLEEDDVDMAGTFEEGDDMVGTFEDSTFGHSTPPNQQTNQGNQQMGQNNNQAVAEDGSMDEEVKALVSRLNALLGKEQEVDEGNKFSGELAKAKEEGDDDFEVDGKEYKVTGNTDEKDDNTDSDDEADDDVKEGFDFADATANEIEKHKNVKEGEQPCNECGLKESKCSCEITESRLFTNLLKMFEEAKDKPDFLDMDKDGDKKESMKKAAKDKQKEKIDEWANSPQGTEDDEEFVTDMDFMTKVISGGLNGTKKDQTVLPKTSVVAKEDDSDDTKQLKKLAGISK